MWYVVCASSVSVIHMTAQTKSLCYELACKGDSTEKAQHLVKQ